MNTKSLRKINNNSKDSDGWIKSQFSKLGKRNELSDTDWLKVQLEKEGLK